MSRRHLDRRREPPRQRAASLARYGIVGRLANDPLHSVSEPAPVGRGVVDAIGHRRSRVEARHRLTGVVSSGDPTQPSPVGKMCPRPLDPILQAPIESIHEKSLPLPFPGPVFDGERIAQVGSLCGQAYGDDVMGSPGRTPSSSARALMPSSAERDPLPAFCAILAVK